MKKDKLKKEIAFPDCWEEVKPREWIYLLELRDKLKVKRGVTLEDIKRGWCAKVLKYRGCRLRSGVNDMLLVNELTKTLDWMWRVDDEECCVELVYNSTVNLLPEWGILNGPADHGADLTFGEFRHAVAAMNQYNEGHDPIDLLALCAILYREPEHMDGYSLRKPFRVEQMAKYMLQVQDMPDWMQWGVYAWFAYFCEYLFSGVFYVDGLELCFASIFRRQSTDVDAKPSEAQSLGMNSVLYSVAESGVFGNAVATDDTLLLRVMMKLLDDKQRADAMLDRIKRSNS